jgi:probable HAF family extracellular repeat protein
MRPVTRPTIRPAITRRGRAACRAVSVVCASAGLLGLAAAPALASTYTMTDLGTLGYPTTVATAINASGQITGESYVGTPVPVKCLPRQRPPCRTFPGHAFLWSNGTMTDLGTLGGLDSQGEAINNLGEVVGLSDTSTSGARSAFADQNGVMTAINSGDATAINSSGEIAGGISAPVAGTGNVFEQAFTYQNGNTTVLGLLPGEGGVFTNATGINSSGEVVGSGDNSASDERAWKYQNGTMTDIGTLGGPQASATAINTSGQIVGFAQTSSDADHGFLYTGGKMTDLGLNIFPNAINDFGVIVGQGPGNAIVGTPGHFQSLQSLVPANSGFTLATAVGINNNGQIVVQGYSNTTGQNHAFLLTPS